MHFKLDENVPLAILSILKIHKLDASDIYSQKLSGIKDKELAKHCKENNYILVTLDKDFSHTTVYPPKDYEAIIILRSKKQGIASITTLFKKFLLQIDLQIIKNKTIIVEEKHIRARSS